MRMLIFLLVLITASCSSSEGEKGVIQIFYIPFGVATYIPITAENIEQSAVKSSELDVSSHMAERLAEILSSASEGGFDEEMIRAKLVWPDSTVVYVDNYGGVKKGTSTLRQLGSDRFSELKDIIEKSTDKK